MKKLFLTQLFAIVAMFAMAVPAQRGQWKTITLADGSKVKVEAVGDEFCHYWRSAAGDTYIKVNDTYVKTDAHKLSEAAKAQRAEVYAHRAARFEKYFGNQYGEISNGKRKAIGGFKQLTGTQKGLVLLVEFQDIHFLPEHTPNFYKRMLNEGGVKHADLAARGYGESVKQYFYDQSNDKFTVDFDVAPIIRMPKNHNSYTNDMRGIIRYAINELKTDPSYNWTQYDWDNDGEIEMVFVLYAGYGQATKGDDTSLIWPHESTIGHNRPIAGGKVFDTYACANEINWNWGEGDLDSGIGTFCHEFAHCLGYPDIYDVCSNTSDGCGLTSMDYWDLLDAGSYNGNSFCPAPFSIFEKMTAGWVTPTELEVGKEYKNLRPITDKDGGDVYVMTNPINKNEFYAFEPIQAVSWAKGFYGAKGLRVVHIDYDANVWAYNSVNCKQNPRINQYSRYTYIPADGSCEITGSVQQIEGDLYPYLGHDFLRLKWNKADNDGNDECSIMLTDIRLESDNTVSFTTAVNVYTRPEGALYYESFDGCYGLGANDGNWSPSASSLAGIFTDNEWTVNGKGARKCLMAGGANQPGTATTGDILLEPGEYKLMFKAARYNNESSKITVSDPNNSTTKFSQDTFELVASQWNDCETIITVGEVTNLRFRNASRGRYFLDEVVILPKDESSAIAPIVNAESGTMNGFFNLSGQKVGADYRGIVIKNGKKYLAK